MRCSLPPDSRVWAYTRDSGGDDQSIGDQNRAVTQFCEQNGLILERLFCDEARSGSTVADRDQFHEMIHLARTLPDSALPDALVVWSFSRLARDFDDAQFYKATLRRRGIAIIPIADDIPADGRHARLVEAVLDWHNDLFLEDLRRATKRGLHDLARQGYAAGGFPPAGYRAEKIRIGTKRDGSPRYASRWIPDPERAPLIRKAFEMRAAGASLREIDEALHIFGAKNSYTAMFRNETYLGIRKCGDLRVEGAHEPLISRELWEAVQRTLHKRPKKGEQWPEGKQHPRRAASRFLLSGLARCVYCGSAMVGSRCNAKTRPNPWPYYYCGKKKRQGWHSCEGRMLNARVVERVVLQTVLNRVLTPAFTEELVAEVNVHLSQGMDGLGLQIEEMRRRIAETTRAIENLLDLVERFGARAGAGRLLEREAERDQLERELRSLEARKAQSHIQVTPEVIYAIIAEARADLTNEDIKVRRAVLRRFVDHVEMGNDGGRIWYSFPLHEVTPLLMVPPTGLEVKACLEVVW